MDHWVCDAWPVRRQTYGYLPSCRASLPFGRYPIILLGDRGTWVWTTCLELLLGSGLAGSRTRDLSILSQCPNHQAASHILSRVSCILRFQSISSQQGWVCVLIGRLCSFCCARRRAERNVQLISHAKAHLGNVEPQTGPTSRGPGTSQVEVPVVRLLLACVFRVMACATLKVHLVLHNFTYLFIFWTENFCEAPVPTFFTKQCLMSF